MPFMSQYSQSLRAIAVEVNRRLKMNDPLVSVGTTSNYMVWSSPPTLALQPRGKQDTRPRWNLALPAVLSTRYANSNCDPATLRSSANSFSLIGIPPPNPVIDPVLPITR